MTWWRWTAALIVLLAGTSARAEKCPNVLILLDRSGSMGGFKWSAARQAITTFTGQRQAVMRFGAMVFPEPGGDACGAGLQVVASDFYTADAITAALGTVGTTGKTPTGDAVAAARALPDLQDATRKRYVILITDGDPTCPDEFNGELNVAHAVTQLDALRQAGIKTFIIGFGQDASPAKLDRMADAGGTARVAATCEDPITPGLRIPCKYYVASDQASLAAALDEIATIASGELKGASCDDSCYGIGGCPAGQRCVQNVRTYGQYQVNFGQCVADPCAAARCGAGQFCREGTCVDACTTPCSGAQVCQDGQCIDDPCATNPAACSCAQPCARFLVCKQGACVDDPCRGVTCPAVAPYCNMGSCFATTTAPGNPLSGGGGDGDQLASTGCSCASAGSVPLVSMALGAWLLFAARKWRRA